MKFGEEFLLQRRDDIRNIAIIAHVDHGKTTLVNQLLKQSDTLPEHMNLEDRAMDSNAIERDVVLQSYLRTLLLSMVTLQLTSWIHQDTLTLVVK